MRVGLLAAILSLITSTVFCRSTETQGCLLGIDTDEQACNSTSLFTYTRKGNKGNKTRKDKKRQVFYKKHMIYWSERARHLTNSLRKRRGVKPLHAGTRRQLQNALNHARKLARLGFLKHQNLRVATKRVGCNRYVVGENIAYNYAGGDLVATCMKQWIHSRGHFNNLVDRWFEEVVVGVFAHRRSRRVYCVQTFAVVVRREKRRTRQGCRVIGK